MSLKNKPGSEKLSYLDRFLGKVEELVASTLLSFQ